jgi:hypothetical protein
MEKKHEKSYQGWTNYETWTVSLWLDNEEASYRYWREAAATCRHEVGDSTGVCDGTWTVQEAAALMLADMLKREIGTASPLQQPGMYSDLLSAALSEVNWQEVAEHWLND